MSSILDINNQIEEYEKKIEDLKEQKIPLNFIKYFNIEKKDVKKMKNLTIEAKYVYNDHENDEYGHDANAYLKITYDNNENLEIEYAEAQGEGTESRYTPTIDCEINGTENAKKLLFKNLDFDEDDYIELRDIIKFIVKH